MRTWWRSRRTRPPANSRYLGELEFLAAELPQYTVSFDANGGETGAMADQTAAVGTALTANGFGRAGYGFAGWNTAADGSGAAVATVPEGGGTLYAQWTDTETPVITMLGYPSITPEWTAGTALVESVSGDSNGPCSLQQTTRPASKRR